MNTLAPASLDITRDLLTGMEWPAAVVRELFHLSKRRKGQAGNLSQCPARPLCGADF